MQNCHWFPFIQQLDSVLQTDCKQCFRSLTLYLKCKLLICSFLNYTGLCFSKASLVNYAHKFCFILLITTKLPTIVAFGKRTPDVLCAKSGHWPGLQRDVAVEHPAVLQLHWLGCGGPFARGGRRGEDGVAAAAQCVAVERVGRGLVVGQRLVVVRWRDGRPQGGLAVMVWSSWGKKW